MLSMDPHPHTHTHIHTHTHTYTHICLTNLVGDVVLPVEQQRHARGRGGGHGVGRVLLRLGQVPLQVLARGGKDLGGERVDEPLLVWVCVVVRGGSWRLV